MQLLATAGGPGPALEGICNCCGTYPGLVVAVVLAAVGLNRNSAQLTGLAVLLVGCVGVFVLVAESGLQPTDDPDELGVHAEVRQMVGSWVVSAVLVGVLAVRLVVRRRFGWSRAAGPPVPPSGSASG